jgi:hypothetical protein
LLIHRTELANGRVGTNHLTYVVTFSIEESGEEHYVVVDAHNGQILASHDNIQHALNRKVTHFGVKVLYQDGTNITEVEGDGLQMIEVNEVMYNVMMNIAGLDGWLQNGTDPLRKLNLDIFLTWSHQVKDFSRN